MTLDPSVVFRSIGDLSDDLRRGRISPIPLVEQILERIEALNPQLNAFITVTREGALADARRAADDIAAGRWRGPLHGVPVAVKDFYDTAGVRTTAAFAQFQNRVPSKDADLVAALRDAGAVLVGKTNMHTLGKGTTSLDSHFGPVVNPWNPAHVAGGSSGGSAVAIASGLCYATVDTDAIGSGRLPAAICGVSCLKPTFGLLTSAGILAGEPVDPAIQTLGHPSVTARSAEDVATALSAVLEAAGNREREFPGNPRSQHHLAVAANYAGDDLTRSAMRYVIDVLEGAGMVVRDVDVPFASASFDLTHVERDRASINASLFRDVSAVVVPTLTEPAPTVETARVRGEMAVSPRNTFFCNYYGLPAITVPMAVHGGPLPLGVQFVGPSGGDAEVLRIAAKYQEAAGWRYQPPPAVQPSLPDHT